MQISLNAGVTFLMALFLHHCCTFLLLRCKFFFVDFLEGGNDGIIMLPRQKELQHFICIDCRVSSSALMPPLHLLHNFILTIRKVKKEKKGDERFITYRRGVFLYL